MAAFSTQEASRLGLLQGTVKANRLVRVLTYLTARPNESFTTSQLRTALDPSAPRPSYRRDLHQFSQQAGGWLRRTPGTSGRSGGYQLSDSAVGHVDKLKQLLSGLACDAPTTGKRKPPVSEVSPVKRYKAVVTATTRTEPSDSETGSLASVLKSSSTTQREAAPSLPQPPTHQRQVTLEDLEEAWGRVVNSAPPGREGRPVHHSTCPPEHQSSWQPTPGSVVAVRAQPECLYGFLVRSVSHQGKLYSAVVLDSLKPQGFRYKWIYVPSTHLQPVTTFMASHLLQNWRQFIQLYGPATPEDPNQSPVGTLVTEEASVRGAGVVLLRISVGGVEQAVLGTLPNPGACDDTPAVLSHPRPLCQLVPANTAATQAFLQQEQHFLTACYTERAL